MQASPESLFEATLAEGVPFKVKAAVTDPSGFHAEGEPLELEFRYLHHLAPIGPPSLWFKRFASQAFGRRFNSRSFGTWSLD